MAVHLRTKARHDCSHIESAALKIGDDTLEVGACGACMLNGVSNADLVGNMMADKHPVKHTKTSETLHLFEIELGHGQAVHVRAAKDLVSVKFANVTAEDFGNSTGM